MGPGWLVDGHIESLGSRLSLPEWLETQRSWIESLLPKVRLPSGVEIP